MNNIIGIDLGTTNSAVSVYENGNYKIIQNKEGRNTTPSIVAFTDKGDILVGETAKRQAITNPENTILSIKRIMGLSYNEENSKKAKDKVQYNIVDKNGICAVKIKDKIYTPQEISAKILMKLKEDAENYLGHEVTDAVITVPAYFNDSQRKATKEAGTIAGLNVKRIINEPTAAALAYGMDKLKEDKKILVVDVGGGTTDISLLDIGDGTFEVLGTDGNAFLGGYDLDLKVANYILDEFKKENSIDLSKDKMAMQRIVDASETLKKELSSSNESDINLPFITANDSGPKHINMKITRSKFESLIDYITEELLIHIKNVLESSKVNKNEIDEIIMVGGSTRIPLIQKMVSNFFNNKQLNKSVNPDEVVAAGASIQGAVLQGEVKDILLLDVTPLSLGVETLGGISTKLIEKGTTIPVSKTEVFSTAEDNQNAVTIHIVQGEREFAKDNKSLGQFNLEGIPAAPKGVPQVEVKLDIDANGILTVSAKEKSSGKEQHITITNSSGLSKEEIDKMVKEAEINKDRDKEKSILVQKRNELDSLTSQIKKQINDMKIDINSVPGLSEKIKEGEEIVKNEIEDKSKIEKVITELQQLVSSMIQQNQQNNSSNTSENKKEEEIIDAEVE